MSTISRYDEVISLPRAVRFPVEMVPPARFDANKLETWPKVAGSLEYVDGRLLFMPPGGDFQQDTVTDVVITLGAWVRRHPDFVLGTNEAGMRLGEATRVLVISSNDEARVSGDERIQAHPGLPELSPKTGELFVQVSSRD